MQELLKTEIFICEDCNNACLLEEQAVLSDDLIKAIKQSDLKSYSKATQRVYNGEKLCNECFFKALTILNLEVVC